MFQNVYQDPVLNTKEVDVAHGKCVGDQKGGTDKRSIKHRPPAIQGGEDYMVNRLDNADREIERMFSEDK